MQGGNSITLPDDDDDGNNVENFYVPMYAIDDEPVYMEFDPDFTIDHDINNNNNYENNYILLDMTMLTLQCLETLNLFC